MDLHPSSRPQQASTRPHGDDTGAGRLGALRDRLRRLTAGTTAGGMMLVGMPFALEYVVRPGDTLSGIAVEHGTTVEDLVSRNGLHRSGDRITAGETLEVPAAHGRDTQETPTSSADDGARRIVRYTVRPGDTASALAVRFHAWTAEIVERNGAVLRAGEQIEIPVVEAAAADRRTTEAQASPAPAQGPAQGPGASRATVRDVITRTAQRYGVDPDLALAVSWQEAGWRMHHTSYAGAIGAMQVMPSTGRWMSGVVGRGLDLRDLGDNVTAGVALLDILLDQAPTRVAVAGYYQGLEGVRKHGMYKDTKRYVANVMALRDQFAAGDYPS